MPKSSVVNCDNCGERMVVGKNEMVKRYVEYVTTAAVPNTFGGDNKTVSGIEAYYCETCAPGAMKSFVRRG